MSLLVIAFYNTHHYICIHLSLHQPQYIVYAAISDYSLETLVCKKNCIRSPPARLLVSIAHTLFAMPLLEPITFFSAPVRGAITPEKAEDMSLGLFSPSPETRSMMYSPQPLVIPSGISSLSRSDPPTPPRGPPPTPRRRAHNELSKSDPPTPPRAPPPTPRRRDVDMFDSLSRRDLPCPPTGLLPAHRRHEADMLSLLFHCEPSSPISGLLPTSGRSDSLGDFNSFSRRDPPTPPGGPPPSPCRRGIFNDLSRCDPPTPPSGPPPSPQRRGVEIYTDLSRSSPPSPPRGPPPTPAKGFRGYNTWTTDETNLLTFVCRSGVKLVSYSFLTLMLHLLCNLYFTILG